ncbi:MAG TPA: hypothetical protein VGX50_09750, partial [Longimicrobium sp.]|nr:hypothetical protein [Longimicrobium sp.]
MQIPVLMVVPATDSLRDSAVAAITESTVVAPAPVEAVPRGVVLDPEFPPVAIGTGRFQEASAESLDPTSSDAFAVRAFVQVETPDQIPEEVDGRQFFSDPQIEPFITCGGSAAVGNVAGVAAKLQLAQLAAKGLDGTGVAIAIVDTGFNLAHLTKQLGSSPRFDAANSWTPPKGTTSPGAYPVSHGTMCAFDALIAAPKATL